MDEKNPKMQNNKKNQKTASGSKWSVLLLLLLVAVVIAATFVIGNYEQLFGGTDSETTQENVIGQTDLPNEQADNTDAAGFPVSFSGGSIENAVCADSHIFVLTSDALTCINSVGSVLYTHTHGFSDPVIKSSSRYCLVYDRQGLGYKVFSKNGLYYEGESGENENIITAFITDDSKVCLATGKVGATSALAYYDKNGKTLFAWSCAKEYIVSVFARDNNLICAAVSSSSGELYTKAYVFDTVNLENNKEYTFEASCATDALITSNEAVIVCTDKIISVNLKNAESKPVINEFTSTVLMRACDSDGNVALLCKKNDSFDDNELTVYSSGGSVLYSAVVPDKVKDMEIDDAKVYILTSTQLIIINSSGETVSTVDIGSASDGLVVDSRRYYRFYLGKLYKI